VRNFLILIVPVVKICKQCLQAASAFGKRGIPLPGLRPWTQLGDFRPKTPLSIAIQMKILGTAIDRLIFSLKRTTRECAYLVTLLY